jgi:predicted DNA-binding ribbon-helix-helix protein
MSTLSLRLPNSLHRKLKELAASEGISINQLLATAAAEKISALTTEQYLNERAARGRKSKFRRVLKKVPSAAPVKGDERQDA